MKIVSFLFFISINLTAFSQLGPAVEQTIHSEELSKTITIDVSGPAETDTGDDNPPGHDVSS